MSNVKYSYVSVDNPKALRGQRIESAGMTTFKIIIKIDLTYASQSEAHVLQKIVNGEFVPLLYQIGNEVQLAKKLDKMSLAEQGKLSEQELEELVFQEFRNLISIGKTILS